MPESPLTATATRTCNTKSPRQVHFGDQDEVPSVPIHQVPPQILKAAKAATSTAASGAQASTSNTTNKGKGKGTAQAQGPTKPRTVTVEDEKTESTQPSVFPALGSTPGANSGIQWHRSGIPGASLSIQNLNPYAYPVSFRHPAGMPDYQHATPQTTGPSFQPPVPDTTFGPMYHVFTPRNDPPGMMAVQQPACAPMPLGQVYLPNQGGMPVQPQMVYGGFQPQQFQPVPMASGGGGFLGPPGPPGAPTMGIPMMPGNQGPPEISGLGRTPMEEAVRQTDFAQKNKLFEPQDFKPADDDPSRFYFVRELDGNWTQRNRFTIENTGDCRWMITPEGWFYAIRQPD